MRPSILNKTAIVLYNKPVVVKPRKLTRNPKRSKKDNEDESEEESVDEYPEITKIKLQQKRLMDKKKKNIQLYKNMTNQKDKDELEKKTYVILKKIEITVKELKDLRLPKKVNNDDDDDDDDDENSEKNELKKEKHKLYKQKKTNIELYKTLTNQVEKDALGDKTLLIVKRINVIGRKLNELKKKE